MFCNKCGRIIEDGAKFCGKCGAPVNVQTNNTISNQSNINEKVENSNNQPNLGQNYNQPNQDYYNDGQNQNYDNIVNPSMKKYAILSIVIPAVSIFIYTFVGLTVYIAIFLSALGFNFAKKGALYSKTLSKIGYVLNTILIVMAVLVWISLLITSLS